MKKLDWIHAVRMIVGLAAFVALVAIDWRIGCLWFLLTWLNNMDIRDRMADALAP